MWEYNYTDELSHKAVKGMRWGYNKGKKNGKRTAGDIIKDKLGYDERERFEKADKGAKRNAEAEARMQDQYGKDRHEMAISDPYTGKVSFDPDAEKYLNNQYSRLERQRKKSDAADKVLVKALEEYKKTPLGKLDIAKEKTNRAKEFVAKHLEKVANKIRNSKK